MHGSNGKSLHVTITSPFRDCEGAYIERYIDQVNSLDFPPDQLRFAVSEGDSVDSTYDQLKQWADSDKRVTLIKYDTYEPRYPSEVNKARFAHLAKVFNAGLDIADQDWSTHTMFLPSDVLYNPDLLGNLLERDKDCIAPMFWHVSSGSLIFYDVWGFIRNGRNFMPYNNSWYMNKYGTEPIEMDFIGGANLSKIEVIRSGVRYRPEDVDHGFCRAAKELGYTLWADPTSHIVHEEK